jgi:hypothetical protein
MPLDDLFPVWHLIRPTIRGATDCKPTPEGVFLQKFCHRKSGLRRYLVGYAAIQRSGPTGCTRRLNS